MTEIRHEFDAATGGIHIKKSHEGLLHQKLGIPAGSPIPESRLKTAEHSNSPSLRKEAQFADNAKHFHHG